MKYLKLKLKTKSGFSNLFTADQIWGQMVCAISALKGPTEVSKFIDQFDKNPPFLISNMFPEGYLPRIILPPFKRNQNEKISLQDEKKNRALAKKNKKRTYIPIEVFLKYQKDIDKLKLAIIDKSPEIYSLNEVRSSIDRMSGRPIEGGVFNQTFLYSAHPFVIYLKIINDSPGTICTIKDIVSYLNLVGLGGDRNVGKGNFEILLEELNENENKLFSFKDSDLYMTISRCSGKDLEPMYYQMNYYFGIVGSSIGERKTFNKYPVVYFEPGSVFKNGNGCILHNVHTDSKICSYGYSFPIYFK